MKQDEFDPVATPIELTDIRSEQIRMVYASIPSSLIAILVGSLILSTTQWELINHGIIIAWFIATNLLSLLRLHFYRNFKRQDRNPIVDPIWEKRALITIILSGITWGMGGYFLFPAHSSEHQLFLAFVVSGMCAGAITTLSSLLFAARTFVVLAIVPVVVKFNLIENDLAIAMTTMSILFITMLMASARRLNQTILESLQVRCEREQAEKTIRRHAQYDELTDLPNRRLLMTILRQEIAKAVRHHRYGAVFFIDLDRFKMVNDTLGHSIGDELLTNAAKKIAGRLRRGDTIGRFGGDEFVALLPEVGKNHDKAGNNAFIIAEEIRSQFAAPFTIQGHEIHLTISIGIALFSTDVSADDLIKYSDVAMYRAKNEGRNSVRLFSSEMQDTVTQQRVIEKGLRQALAKQEFELYFQAQYDAGGLLTGAETLLRWNHPEKGVVAPGLFIEIAEQTGLIVPIGDWILHSACEQLTRLDTELMLAVNVSPRQFSDPEFVDHLKRILEETRADPNRLRFEITESLALVDIDYTIDTINELKALGISFSIDDFGTGYSSLSYLNRLPVDELKIDQSFVRNISDSPENAVIVDTIIIMARQLNLEIVAEGVESQTELDYLKERQCDYYQGYYFSKPVPFDDFLQLASSTKP